MPVSSRLIARVDDIPTPTVQCHASNLLQLPSGDLLCVWFGGTQEGTSDISIHCSRLPPSSSPSSPPSSWSTPQQVSHDATRSEQNPILFRDPSTGTIWLLHTSQEAGNQDQASVICRTSPDEGTTWSPPRELFPGKRGAFIRQPIVVLEDGTWVLPIWHCRVPAGYRWIGSDDVSAVWYSRDQGATWAEEPVPESQGCVHMNIVAMPSPSAGGYVALFRSRWADNVYRSTSADGIRWSPPRRTPLPNPNSGICAAALPSPPAGAGSKLVAVFNDSNAERDMPRREGLYDDITPASDTRENQPPVNGKEAIWGAPRKALSVAVSADRGETWRFRVLEDEGDGFCLTNDSKGRSNRELSYPSIWVGDGVGKEGKGAHVAFTYLRQNIRYVYLEDVEAFVEESPSQLP